MMRSALCKLLLTLSSILLACASNTGVAQDVAQATYSDNLETSSLDDSSNEPDFAPLNAGQERPRKSKKSTFNDIRRRTPAMVGDFYGGNPIALRANSTVDRVFVFANDLDAPFVLPPANSTLSISEPGPVGVYSSTLTDINQIQSLLRNASPLPPANLIGVVTDDARLSTSLTIGQIQSLIGATPVGFDIIPVAAPSSTYNTAVDSIFRARNTIAGSTMYNSAASGSLLQGGADTLNGGEDLDAFYFYEYVIRFNTLLADATSGGVGRMKIAEGGTVLPQNRVFFRYNFLSGANYTDSRSALSRFVPGFERAFLDGLFSVELRAPFAADARTGSTFDGSSITSGERTHFGNLNLLLKGLLIEREHFALSGGMGLALPTAQDVTVNYADGTPLLRVSNEMVRLQPFLGSLYTPNDKWFVQSFLQVDAAANGSAVSINANGAGLAEVGRLNDSTNLFADVGLGYWLYRSQSSRGLTGIIPMVEVHQNTSFQNGDFLTAGPFQVTNSQGTGSLTNIVIGNTLEFSKRANLSTAYVGPIGGGVDRQFNGALQVFLSSGW